MPGRDVFQLGPITVRWYGIMIMLGVVLASIIAYREARRRGEDPDNVWGLFPWVLVFGIVGARLGWVIADLKDVRSLYDAIAIWQGGLSIQGSVIGGAIAVIIYCRRNHLSFWKWGDIIVPGLALGQAVGRWGNFFNQEAFGAKTDLPWGIPISVERQRAVMGTDYGPNARFQPTFAYEMIWDLINFGILMWLGRQKRLRLLEGDLIWIYLTVYSIGRFIIEAIRVDSATIFDIKTPQVVALATIIFAWAMLIYRHRPGTNARLAVVNAPVGTQRRASAQSSHKVRRIPSTLAKGGTDENSLASEASTQPKGTLSEPASSES